MRTSTGQNQHQRREANQAKDTTNKLFLTEKCLSHFILRKPYFRFIQKQTWPNFYCRKIKLPKILPKTNREEEKWEEKEKAKRKKK